MNSGQEIFKRHREFSELDFAYRVFSPK